MIPGRGSFFNHTGRGGGGSPSIPRRLPRSPVRWPGGFPQRLRGSIYGHPGRRQPAGSNHFSFSFMFWFDWVERFFLGMGGGQRHDERRALPGLAFSPSRRRREMRDFPDNGQAHARAFVFAAAVQPLEHIENPVQIFFIKSDAVVADV